MNNALIIIGNGFDLAHESKHLFAPEKNDNFKDYFDTSYKRYLQYIFKHDLHDRFYNFDENGNTVKMGWLNEPRPLIGYEFGNETERPKLYTKKLFADFIEETLQKENKYKSKLLLSFVKTLSLQNWVDIEEEYFNLLYEKFKNNENPERFNQEFELIIDGLDFYLKGWKSMGINAKINVHFNELANKYSKINNHKILPVHILNFNFTPTVEQYIAGEKTYFDLNYIHGKIGDQANPLVFGYGNEADKRYVEIEESNKNEYLKYFKSYAYSKTTNYRNLLSFIDAEPFEVIIMGHSCGNSDGVMLKTIFEHENCKEIEIKFHQKPNGTTDFDDKAKNIARHFTDKASFRKKLMPFSESKALVPL